MPLPTPILDDRTFKELVDEARARIPRFTPEWTNFNESDPGMTLVKVHAWLTETILYRLNKLPDLNYIKFLELLNVRPHPAVPAKAQLTFTLKKLNRPDDPLVVLIPKNTQAGVDDPDLEEELIFETDQTLTALNAALATIIVPGAGEHPGELATEYDADAGKAKIPRPFFPFGKEPDTNAVCLLGVLLRPHRKEGQDYSLDRFPEGELDLTVLVPEVFEINAYGVEITGPENRECLFPWQVTEQGESIVWEAYTGTEHDTQFSDVSPGSAWLKLSALDETAALTRSGHVYLDVPGGLPAVAFSKLHRSFWEDLGLKKPPTDETELIDDIDNGIFDPTELDDEVWEDLGLSDPVFNDPGNPLSDQIRAATLDFGNVDNEKWIEVGYDEAPVLYELTWFRARLEAAPEVTPQVSHFLLNTCAATAAVTRVEEILGTSDGRPNQTHTLKRTPVLVDEETGKPDLKLELVAQGRSETWEARDDFYGTGPDDAVFLLDVDTGTITFGDGEHGRIPVAGAEIIARSYRYRGGQVGNAGPETITALKSVLSDVDKVTNVRAAAGGADAEALSEVILRAPHDLRMRERAVTGDDFAELAMQTPGVRIQRAYALSLTKADLTTDPPSLVKNIPGAVTVVILPENKEDTPQPTEDQLRLVCDHLNSRRLITTELYVAGPRYLELAELSAEVLVDRQHDLKTVHEAIVTNLLDYFHPMRGGEDGSGWPFGHDIYFANIYRQILNTTGVLRVQCLGIRSTSSVGQVADQDACQDLLEVEDGTLVYLPRTAINLKVQYDPNS
jgi:hypothetical protein